MPDEAREPQSTSGSEPGSEDAPFQPPGFLDALKGAFPRAGLTRARRPRSETQPATGTSEDAQRVNYLDRRERTIAGFLSIFQIVLGVLLFFAYRHYVKHPGKGVSIHQAHIDTINTQHSAPWFLVVNVVLGLAIAGGVLTKRRALGGFTIVLAGLAMFSFGGGLFLGAIYVAVGIWLILRASGKSSRRRLAAAGQTTTSGSGKAIGTAAVGSAKPAPPPPKKAPVASSRYTPPRPSRRPAPKPAPNGKTEEQTGIRGWVDRKLGRDQASW